MSVFISVFAIVIYVVSESTNFVEVEREVCEFYIFAFNSDSTVNIVPCPTIFAEGSNFELVSASGVLVIAEVDSGSFVILLVNGNLYVAIAEVKNRLVSRKYGEEDVSIVSVVLVLTEFISLNVEVGFDRKTEVRNCGSFSSDAVISSSYFNSTECRFNNLIIFCNIKIYRALALICNAIVHKVVGARQLREDCRY